jgi:osmoprotectant transport system permease protein
MQISPKRANDAALRAAVQPLIGRINVELMREANARASGEKAEQPQAVAKWMWERIER